MPTIPARCTQCGYQWQPADGISIGNLAGTTTFNNAISCPKCGVLAKHLEGTFDVVDGAIVLKSGPEWSWDLVAELRLGLKQIIEEKPADPVAALAEVNQDMAAALEQAARGRTRDQILLYIGTLYTVLGTDYSKVKGNVGGIVTLIETFLQHVANSPR